MAGIKVIFIVLMCICVVGCDHSLKIKEPQFNKRRTPEHNVQYLDKINAEAAKKNLNKKEGKKSQYEFINQEQQVVPEHAIMDVKDKESHNTSSSKPKEIWSEEDDEDYEYDDITSMQVAEDDEVGAKEAPIKIIKRQEEVSSAKYIQIKPKKASKKNAIKIQAKATASSAAPAPAPVAKQEAPPSLPVPQQPLPDLQPPISPPLDSGLPPKPNLKINKIPPKTKDAMQTQELMEKKQVEAKALYDKAQNLKPVQPQQVPPQSITQSPPQQPAKVVNNNAATSPAVTPQPLPSTLPTQKENPVPITPEPNTNSGNMDDKLQELLKSYDNPTK